VIAEFSSAVQAVRAAVAIQRALLRRNADLPSERRMEYRIGVNLGDVMVDSDNLLGDGVNVAARLKGVADLGGICISGVVRDQIEGKLNFPLTSIGQRSLKNISRPVSVYCVDWRLQHSAASRSWRSTGTIRCRRTSTRRVPQTTFFCCMLASPALQHGDKLEYGC
jgi:adenylate cyclase